MLSPGSSFWAPPSARSAWSSRAASRPEVFQLALSSGTWSAERHTFVSLRLRDVTDDDLPLIEQWLNADHVRTTWGDPGANLRLLKMPPACGHWRAIIEADGRTVGIVLWQHPTREELDAAGLADIPTSVIDIDIMIGELDALGQGLGSGAICLVAGAALSDPTVPFVMACARLNNLASRRAFAKASFREDREFDDVPNGLHVLMVCHREEGQVALTNPDRACAAKARGLCREVRRPGSRARP